MTVSGTRIHFSKYAGLALISLSILMLELTLTRIFSVTMWYHFAFVAISVALFGISASGLAVFLFEDRFARENLDRQLVTFSSLMALLTVVAIIIALRVPFAPSLTPKGLATTGLIYGAVAAPFFMGGVCITLLLWHQAERVSGLYFSDLFGAALGCLFTLLAANVFKGPQVVLLTALIAAAASICFSLSSGRRAYSYASGAVFLVVAVILIVNRFDALTEIRVVKDSEGSAQMAEQTPIFEKWNSFSRVTVYPPEGRFLFGWGLSSTYEGYRPPHQIMMIDASAVTPMVRFDGDFGRVEFLKYDVTSLVYWLKKQAKVMIIGSGAGRDVLAALVLGQKPVIGVDINPIVVSAVRDVFDDFTGNLYARPDVEIHIDEGRSFLTKTDERYDIIQASLVDTWAATSSGAFALTENNLYTLEAFESYLKHLNDGGMLTFSRWYWEEAPGETLRLAALGIESLERTGVTNPRNHLVIAKNRFWLSKGPDGVSTMILKKTPFSLEELAEISRICQRMKFSIVCSPNSAANPTFGALFDKAERERLYRDYPLNIVPPNDDRPFFFHMARFRHLFSTQIKQGLMEFNMKAVTVLANLLIVMAILTLLFLILPLFLFHSMKPRQLIVHWRYLLYFVLIGCGFIMVEIPLIQRFTLFLGHPIYSLAVVLFSLLLFSSFGSFFTRRATADDARLFLIKALISLVIILSIYLLLLSHLVHALIQITTPLKILVTLGLTAPAGFLMGMILPLGIKLVSRKGQSFLVPWCWSLNGAFSVLSSVGAIVVAITFGFTAAMAIGAGAYLAVLALVVSSDLR